jgi:hypothetical protein
MEIRLDTRGFGTKVGLGTGDDVSTVIVGARVTVGKVLINEVEGIVSGSGGEGGESLSSSAETKDGVRVTVLEFGTTAERLLPLSRPENLA